MKVLSKVVKGEEEPPLRAMIGTPSSPSSSGVSTPKSMKLSSQFARSRSVLDEYEPDSGSESENDLNDGSEPDQWQSALDLLDRKATEVSNGMLA